MDKHLATIRSLEDEIEKLNSRLAALGQELQETKDQLGDVQGQI